MKYSQKRVARLFDECVTGKSVLITNKITTLVKQTAFDSLRLKPNDTLLDVGTGTGKWAIQAAKICQNVIGIDISRKSLERAAQNARKEKVNNIIFSFGSFEEPCKILDLHLYPINKILVLYSFHHLPDELKKEAIVTISKFLHRPGRIVIGDMMFFDNPKKYQDRFKEVNYDGGETDFPAYTEFLIKCFRRLLVKIKVRQIHPLAGVITADFI
ncbi:MAG: class I SAM-dependent methyltransferase [Candidatus Latescibacteria bacterium]|nr:class I SAM-dependent methyltransferase [Candidatus Latescibacterota bacterium]